MAERIPQEDGSKNLVSISEVQGGGGNGNGDTTSPIQHRADQLFKDLVASQERNREEIEARYPRIFGGGTKTDVANESIGTVRWEFGYGWDALVESLVVMINLELEKNPELKFHVEEIKEKFGTLRVCATGGNRRIEGMIMMAEDMSASVCEVCGSLGTLCSNGGWQKTLCEDCALKLQYTVIPMDDDNVAFGDS